MTLRSEFLEAAVTKVLQEVDDTAPWAYTYKERPADLLEIRASELEGILRGALRQISDEIEQLRTVVAELDVTVLTLRLGDDL